MKKLLILLAALGLMTQMAACKANNAQDDAEFVENADVEKVDAEEQLVAETTTAPEVNSSTENLSTDSSLEAALGEASPAVDQVTQPEATATANDGLSLDAAATDTTTTATQDIAAAPTIDENSLSDVPAPQTDTLSAATTNDVPMQDPMAPADSSLVNDAPIADVPMTTEAPVYTAEKAKKYESSSSSTPAKKSNNDMKLSDITPYAYEGGFVNTAYIVRPKEKLKDISQTIFGSDKSKELKKINTYLKARAPRPGDKVFYVSPNRPSDSARMITYYEDTGMMAETYTVAKGENLKKFSKKLLGYDNAWKEIWATNGIESKTKLAEGETIKYWKSAASITPVEPVANNNTLPQIIDNANQLPAAPVSEPALDPALANNAQPPQMELPPPPPDMAMNPPAEAAMPPPPDMNAAPPQDMAMNNPPPADTGMPTPPPPDMAAAETQPDKQPAGAASMEEVPVGEGQDLYTMLGIGVLVCGVVAFVIVRRKKKRAAEEMAMGETGVGI